MKKTRLLIALFICSTTVLQAQFFKKLGKKIKKASERTVERKVENKASKETEKAFDSTFNKKRGNNKRLNVVNISPADNYSFDYRAEMQYTSGKDEMDLDYFLPKSGNFLGLLIKDKRVKHRYMSVYDINLEAMFSFMENEGKKIQVGVSFETDNVVDEALNESSVSIAATGKSKSILSYNCKEYEVTGEDMTASIWVTNEIDFRFPDTFYNIKQDKNSMNQNQGWMKNVDGWTMEMVMTVTKKKKPKTIHMKCLKIDTSTLKINTSEYQNMSY